MPSRVSRLLWNPEPFGQMMETRYPASRKARASCHTRRSRGTGRFSTMIQTAGRSFGMPAPQFKIHQSPKLLLAVADPVKVFANKFLHAAGVEKPARRGLGRKEQVCNQGPQGFLKPFTNRHAKSDLAPEQRLLRHIRPQRLLQQRLGSKAARQQASRKTRRQLHQALIEERSALLNRCSHGHQVAAQKQVIRQPHLQVGVEHPLEGRAIADLLEIAFKDPGWMRRVDLRQKFRGEEALTLLARKRGKPRDRTLRFIANGQSLKGDFRTALPKWQPTDDGTSDLMRQS